MTKANYRLFRKIALVLCFALSTAAHSLAEQYTFVADVFYESYVNAESFDAYVYQNKEFFDGNFHSCLNAIYDYYFPKGAAHAKQCGQMAGVGQDYLQCIQSNIAAGIVVWIQNIRMVLRGQAIWKDTLVGGSVITALVLMRAMGDPAMVNMIIEYQKRYVRQMMPSLYCTINRIRINKIDTRTCGSGPGTAGI